MLAQNGPSKSKTRKNPFWPQETTPHCFRINRQKMSKLLTLSWEKGFLALQTFDAKSRIFSRFP